MYFNINWQSSTVQNCNHFCIYLIVVIAVATPLLPPRGGLTPGDMLEATPRTSLQHLPSQAPPHGHAGCTSSQIPSVAVFVCLGPADLVDAMLRAAAAFSVATPVVAPFEAL